MNFARREAVLFVLALILAFGFWYLIFVAPWGVFWVKMAAGAGLLGVISLLAVPGGPSSLLAFRPGHVGLGVISAGLLYGVFWVGRLILVRIWAGGGQAVGSVYAPRESFPLWAITLLLLLLTGPAEEIFWRGFIQRYLAKRLGDLAGVAIATVLYAAVHLWTANPALILAALVAGVAWGGLFVRTRSLLPGIISHSLWGVAIFVIWPLG
jgi:membrane protease YdiL (CAAX protease family)